MVGEKSEPTVGDLLGTLATSTASLVRQEVHLVSTELGNKASQATHAVGMVAIGGAAIHIGLLMMGGGVVIALAALVPMWMSALAIGGVVAVIGIVMLGKGLGALRRLDVTPRATLKTLEDDAVWAKEQVR